ncbi:ras-related protein Rab-3A-like isoform X1 [Mizuhopecten yessoensis]|uniref:Ras-related protein Rab-3A n=1 Tax=Mizuhopecten yessoensis TaxID=6573 RepID=A0A210QEX4_MIZYE|nr:ras-related protein Rab-3A-like isoform X1 [Mizuhopecten yessoensis]OWF47327.1 Ras-related protein Rab-3A [Mizuhopecten yessoensis]
MPQPRPKSHARDVKIAVIGNNTVGKTSLSMRYIYGDFHPGYFHTRGGDIYLKQIKVLDQLVNLKLIDTAGHAYQRSLIGPLYKDADGVIIQYDVTNEKTFNALADWIIAARDQKCREVVLVGNKMDLCQSDQQEQVTKDLNLIADNHNLRCYLVSAKTGLNVNRPFNRLIREVLQRQAAESTEATSLQLSQPKETQPTGCLDCILS